MGPHNRRAVEEERIQRRPGQILDAAARVFARKGFHRSTTREIAAEAGVAEGTIYNYYKSKQDLLMAMVARLAFESLFEIVARADKVDARTFLTEILRDRLELLDRNREVARAIIPELIIDAELRRSYVAEVIAPVAEQMMAYFGKRIRMGDFRQFDPRIILPAVVGATLATGLATSGEFVKYGGAGTPPPREEVIAQLVEFILHGIAGDDNGETQANRSCGS